MKRLKLPSLAGLLSALLATAAIAADPVVTPGKKSLPLPGESLLFDNHEAFLILPPGTKGKVPWVWFAPTLAGLPSDSEKWMFERFLKAGIAIAGIDVGESHGSPAGQETYDRFHHYLTSFRGLSRKPVLLARSRGGLMLYNWATAHPDKVAAVAGIYPVCDLASFPGLAKAAPAYGMSVADLTAKLREYNPIDRLKPLADAKVPLLHLHGDADRTVPLEANSMELARRYRELGGPVELEVMKGRGHDMWDGWFQSEKLTDFVIKHAIGKTADAAPGDLVSALEKLKLPGVKINAVERWVDVDSAVCLTSGALELIACTRDTKEHESIVVVDAKPMHIHTALLLLGARAGSPAMRRLVSEDPVRWIDVPPSGAPVKVSLAFQDKDGKSVERPIGDFLERNSDGNDQVFRDQPEGEQQEAQKFPTSTFIFTGSQLIANGDGPKTYIADQSGNVISISTFGDEVLSLPDVVGQDNGSLAWEVDPTHLPPLGSKILLRLRPVYGK